MCNEIPDKVIQHLVRAIETQGRQVQYLKTLQTLVKAENQTVRKCQDFIMVEVGIYNVLLWKVRSTYFFSRDVINFNGSQL